MLRVAGVMPCPFSWLRPRSVGVLLGLVLILGVTGASFSATDSSVDFNRDVRPILSDKCFFCHGPDSGDRRADLRLDVGEGEFGAFAQRGKKNPYAVIVPGDPDGSVLVERIIDPDDPMPPEDSHKTISPEEVATLKQWIVEGAPYDPAWAYLPPKVAAVPTPTTHWDRTNEIDQFVHRRLEAEGLQPSPRADSVTLVRRSYFDLTGLPPTPEEVRAYVTAIESSGQATDGSRASRRDAIYQDLVDRLLASPEYAERMATYWLDLVRFADTVGYHGDQDHRIALYRDYVIRSFDQNLPFDQFTREQLAGDLLPSPTKWQRIASGYNRLLQTSHEGGIQRKEYLAIYAADRVRNVSNVWMGATIGCAQCHDHKYDPYTLRDFYSLGAFFADLHDDGFTGNSLPTIRPPEERFFTDEQQSRLDAIDAEIQGLISPEDQARWKQLEKELADLVKSLDDKKTDAAAKKELQEKRQSLEDQLDAVATAAQRKQLQELVTRRQAIVSEGRVTMVSAAQPPLVTRILPGGDWLDETGEIVLPAVPAFLGDLDLSGRRATRRDLANWLVDTDQGIGGLTARVFANRMWYLFFGNGISPSLDDFGGQGQPPADPELLDYLAIYFYTHDWDVKKLVRHMVLSETYRQSSLETPAMHAMDPNNRWLQRQARFRLPAEMVRDNALAVSGLLVREVGGESVKPYQPAGYYRHLNFPERTYRHHTDKRQYRRAVYMHWQRQFLHPMLKAFDAPSREECTAERPRSNTPLAALVLLNDPTFVEASRALAGRMLTESPGDDPEARIAFGFELVTSRQPTAEEVQILGQTHKKAREEYATHPELVDQLAANGMWNGPNDLEPSALAAWTVVARVLLNLNEAITRN